MLAIPEDRLPLAVEEEFAAFSSGDLADAAHHIVARLMVFYQPTLSPQI
jgi:hypothetical protein